MPPWLPLCRQLNAPGPRAINLLGRLEAVCAIGGTAATAEGGLLPRRRKGRLPIAGREDVWLEMWPKSDPGDQTALRLFPAPIELARRRKKSGTGQSTKKKPPAPINDSLNPLQNAGLDSPPV